MDNRPVLTADLLCTGISDPIRLSGNGLLPLLRDFLGSWSVRVLPASSCTPVISVEHSSGRWRLTAPWLPRPLEQSGLAAFLSDFGVDLITAWLRSNQDFVGIHAAAVQCGKGLTLFPNQNKAGKSLLAACLTAAGHICYGDDLIALTPEGRARSFGLPLRLRLPLPQLPPDVKKFICDRLAFADEYYAFLQTEHKCRAVFGQEQHIGHVVFLNRRPAGRACLTGIDAESALKKMLNRCLLLESRQALPALELCKKIIDSASVWRLDYSDAREAVEILSEKLASPCVKKQMNRARPVYQGREAPAFKKESSAAGCQDCEFSHGGSLSGGKPGSICPGSAGFDAGFKEEGDNDVYFKDASASLKADCAYVRKAGVICRKEGEGAFLVNRHNGMILHLNSLGTSIWDCLGEPVRPAELAELISSAYPSVAVDVIHRDVLGLFEDLLNEGLILPVPAERA
ncbi:MAG: PqqD family protein [Desulfovibrionaceae bacterium]|nr:PqqD family protein [Desulfovibrionaceae bacterium]